MSPFFLRLFLLFWLPILPFMIPLGVEFALWWTIAAAIFGWFISDNSRAVLRDFVDYVDSGKALEDPGAMTVRRSFLYGPLIRRFKKIQKALGEEIARAKRERELLYTVLGGISDGVIALDRRRDVLFCNGAARALCEIKKPEVFGKSVEEAVPLSAVHEMSRDPDFFARPLVRRVTAFQENEERHLALASAPFGGGEGAVFTVRDLSDDHRQEQARREFVANASHDLGTPLMAIRGYLDSLAEGDLPPDLRARFFAKLSDNVDRLSVLSRKLTALAQAPLSSAAGAARVPLAAFVREVAEPYEVVSRSKGLEFALEARGEGAVLVPHEHLRTVLENLLDNALKFTPAPGRIAVLCEATADPCVVEVRDSGIGVDPAERGKIFERFYRSDRARTSEGTGLGLAIVKKWVTAMGGTVDVESAAGSGSVFRVSLPRATA